jgi:hypothetical protein
MLLIVFQRGHITLHHGLSREGHRCLGFPNRDFPGNQPVVSLEENPSKSMNCEWFRFSMPRDCCNQIHWGHAAPAK